MVLPTGFDYPDIDLIACIVTGVYCQMEGRGEFHTDPLLFRFAGKSGRTGHNGGQTAWQGKGGTRTHRCVKTQFVTLSTRGMSRLVVPPPGG